MSKEKLKARVEHITETVRDFCTEKLNDQYWVVLEKVIGKLSRKRPSPLLRGSEANWAAGIVHAVGQINFLYDRSFEPYVSVDELNQYFGTKKGTVTTKASDIRKMLKLNRMTSFDYMVDDRREDNPMFNMVMVDGLFMPISALPEAYQEMVRAAHLRGKDISFRTNNT